jgi:hypothetical protein
MSRARAALLACACSVACSGSPFRGGYAQPETTLTGSKTLARLIPGHCEDPARDELTPRFTSVDLAETQTGRTVLLEHRQGHELLVVENFHEQGSSWVFELLVQGGRVRRWRIPRTANGSGTVEMGRLLTLVRHGDRFEAGLASSQLTCTLVPKGSSVLPTN